MSRAVANAGDAALAYAGHAAFIAAFLVAWELASKHGWLDPTFFGYPSGVAQYLWEGFVVKATLWKQLGYTVAGTLVSFLLGSAMAILLALAPLFLLWFGLGIGSKIAVGTSLAFFIVLSSTVAGMRGVNPDHLTLSRSLGARPLALFTKVTLPSAVPVIFSGLRLGLIYSMLGVIGAELIAAEHGLGQTLSYLQSTFHMNGVMGLLVLLACLGMLVTRGMTALERRLLRWQ